MLVPQSGSVLLKLLLLPVLQCMISAARPLRMWIAVASASAVCGSLLHVILCDAFVSMFWLFLFLLSS